MAALRNLFLFLFLGYLLPHKAIAQSTAANTTSNGSSSTSIPTAVPFLTISPDARSGGMGEAGVAISPDVNAVFWNPSKLVFLENNTNFSASYTPWLRNLSPGISLNYFSFAQKLDEQSAIGASIRYFNLGNVELYDSNETSQGISKAFEYAVDASYSRKFGDDLSMGLTFRYIQSNFSNATTAQGSQPAAGSSVAADVSLYYKTPRENSNDAAFSFGANISNIGPKISYSGNGPFYFLPTNLKLGVANTWSLDDMSSFTIALDLNKLLVPTPPMRDANGNIIKGTDDTNTSLVAGIFGSFTDAPGGFSQELKEINFSPAFEYTYNRQFSLRAGYFYENAANGGRQYLTLGTGINYADLNFNFSYLVARQSVSPLANTLRISLVYSFGGDRVSYR